MDIFAVDGSDEGLVQFPHDVMSKQIAFLFEVVDPFYLFLGVLEVLHELDETLGDDAGIVDRLLEELKKVYFLRKDSHKFSRQVMVPYILY